MASISQSRFVALLLAGALVTSGCVSPETTPNVDQPIGQPAVGIEAPPGTQSTATAEPAIEPTVAVEPSAVEPPTTDSVDTGSSDVLFDLRLINSMADFDLLEADDDGYHPFCDEMMRRTQEDPEVLALHDRVGFNPDLLYEDLWLGCFVRAEAKAQAVREPKGTITEQDRSRGTYAHTTGPPSLATFDFYDSTFDAVDLTMSGRAFRLGNPRETPSQSITFSTLFEGGYSSASSRLAIRVRMFDIRTMVNHELQCGPTSLTVSSDSENDELCEATSYEVMGAPVFRGQGIPKDQVEYSLTVGHTRIRVVARSEAEAIAVLESLTPASADEMDWFYK